MGSEMCRRAWAHGILAEHDDGREVAERHERHCDVGEPPDEVERNHRPGIDYGRHQQAIDPHCKIAVADKADVGLAVVIVGYYACESKEEDGHTDEDRAETVAAAESGVNGLLGQHYSVMATGVDSAAQYDESRGRAHQQSFILYTSPSPRDS